MALGSVWLFLLLVARHRVESGLPPSHPASRGSRGWVRAAQGLGGAFGGFLGTEFGGLLEMIAVGAAMAILSTRIVPHQKRLRSGTSDDRRIEGRDDGSGTA